MSYLWRMIIDVVGHSAIAIIGCSILASCVQHQRTTTNENTHVAATKSEFSDKDREPQPITLVAVPSEELFPSGWLVSPLSVKFSALPESQVEPSRQAVISATRLYPADMLSNELGSVVLLGSLIVYDGTKIGGSYDKTKKRLYVVGTVPEERRSAEYVAETFHHELSSLILLRYWPQFPEREWCSLNPPGFSYGVGGSYAIREQHGDRTPTPQNMTAGFLNDYSRTNIEEDFNQIIEIAMGRPTWASGMARRYPLMAAKIRLAMRFYHDCYPGFRSPVDLITDNTRGSVDK